MDIHIFWEGPFKLNELSGLNDKDRDYGVYQVYGQHHLYGNSVLLYIGQANQQTFGTRLPQEEWQYESDPLNIQIYIGRLAGHKLATVEEWETKIDQAEKLLIYSHQPIYEGRGTSLNTQITQSSR